MYLPLRPLYSLVEIGFDGDTQAQNESVLNMTIYFELGFWQEVLPLAAPYKV